MAKKEAVSLSAMLGGGETVIIQGKKYTVKPLKLKEVEEFTNDKVSVTSQLFNVLNEEARNTLDKWLQRKVADEKGQPFSMQRAMEEDWELPDLRKVVQAILDLSG